MKNPLGKRTRLTRRSIVAAFGENPAGINIVQSIRKPERWTDQPKDGKPKRRKSATKKARPA
jgi:hypothetical protein